MASSQIKTLTAAINSLLQLQLQREQSKDANADLSSKSIDVYNQLSRKIRLCIRRHNETFLKMATTPRLRTRLRVQISSLGNAYSSTSGQTGSNGIWQAGGPVAPKNATKMRQEGLIDILKNLFRDKTSLTRRRIEILNYRYDKSIPIAKHIDRINRFASDFECSKFTDDDFRVLLLLQSLCFSRENDDLKKMALRVVEKNQDTRYRLGIGSALERVGKHENHPSNLLPSRLPNLFALKGKTRSAFWRNPGKNPINRKVHRNNRLLQRNAMAAGVHIYVWSAPSVTRHVTSVPKRTTSRKCAALVPRSITWRLKI